MVAWWTQGGHKSHNKKTKQKPHQNHKRPLKARMASITLSSSAPTNIVCETIFLKNKPKNLAFVLRNVFSPEECQDMIRHSEAIGYGEALINVGGGRQVRMAEVRNNDRCIIDDDALAAQFLQRIEAFIPKQHKGHRIAGMNERLRFLRYDPGQKFEGHFDGRYTRSEIDCPDKSKHGEFSAHTVQIYLNSDCTGGATRFFLQDFDEDEYLDVQPTVGSVLVFEQEGVFHQGCEVTSGRKYTIRTEVMYRPEK